MKMAEFARSSSDRCKGFHHYRIIELENKWIIRFRLIYQSRKPCQVEYGSDNEHHDAELHHCPSVNLHGTPVHPLWRLDSKFPLESPQSDNHSAVDHNGCQEVGIANTQKHQEEDVLSRGPRAADEPGMTDLPQGGVGIRGQTHEWEAANTECKDTDANNCEPSPSMADGGLAIGHSSS